MRYALLIFSVLLVPSLAAQALADSAYVPSYDPPRDGTEVVAVYFGGSTCAPCRFPTFKAGLRDAIRRARAYAEEAGYAFAYVGVANDWDLEDGLAFLDEAGPFDEITVGRNWFNLASVAHVFQNEEAVPALPSLVVFERDISNSNEFGATRYLTALMGPQVLWWVERDAPLPYSHAEDLAGMSDPERSEHDRFLEEAYRPR